jgi:hypothetical protein
MASSNEFDLEQFDHKVCVLNSKNRLRWYADKFRELKDEVKKQLESEGSTEHQDRLYAQRFQNEQIAKLKPITLNRQVVFNGYQNLKPQTVSKLANITATDVTRANMDLISSQIPDLMTNPDGSLKSGWQSYAYTATLRRLIVRQRLYW